MVDISSDAIRARSVSKMPSELGELYPHFRDEIAWLHLKWFNFRRLYASEPETVDLLNSIAPEFFRGLQDMMWQDVLLHLSRLTDPPKSSGKQNLTVLRIADLIPEDDAALRDEVRSLASTAKGKAEFAREWRNRRLAHKELPPMKSEIARPLPLSSRNDTDDALSAVRATVNRIELRYEGSVVSYDLIEDPLGGVSSFLRVLRKGAEERRSEGRKDLGTD